MINRITVIEALLAYIEDVMQDIESDTIYEDSQEDVLNTLEECYKAIEGLWDRA